MKKVLFILALLLTGCDQIGPKGPVGVTDPDQLIDLYKQYHADQDVKNMLRLYCWDGISSETKDRTIRGLKRAFGLGIKDIKLVGLPPEFLTRINKPVTVAGQTVSYNLTIEGQLDVLLDGNRGEAYLFGRKDGIYFISLQKNSLDE